MCSAIARPRVRAPATPLHLPARQRLQRARNLAYWRDRESACSGACTSLRPTAPKLAPARARTSSCPRAHARARSLADPLCPPVSPQTRANADAVVPARPPPARAPRCAREAATSVPEWPRALAPARSRHLVIVSASVRSRDRALASQRSCVPARTRVSAPAHMRVCAPPHPPPRPAAQRARTSARVRDRATTGARARGAPGRTCALAPPRPSGHAVARPHPRAPSVLPFARLRAHPQTRPASTRPRTRSRTCATARLRARASARPRVCVFLLRPRCHAVA